MLERLKKEIEDKGVVTERFKINAGASSTMCTPYGEYYKCRVNAQPTKSEANNKLLAHLKSQLPGVKVELVGGHSSDQKTIRFTKK